MHLPRSSCFSILQCVCCLGVIGIRLFIACHLVGLANYLIVTSISRSRRQEAQTLTDVHQNSPFGSSKPGGLSVGSPYGRKNPLNKIYTIACLPVLSSLYPQPYRVLKAGPLFPMSPKRGVKRRRKDSDPEDGEMVVPLVRSTFISDRMVSHFPS